MRDAETVTFGGAGLDRDAAGRADPARIAALATASQARILPLWRGKALMRDDGLEGRALAPLAPDAACLHEGPGTQAYLGCIDGAPWFARDVSHWEPEMGDAPPPGVFLDPTEQRPPGLPADHRYAELRAVMTQLSAGDAELAATARGLLEWHRTHPRCARCGAPSEVAEAGWQRRCPDCGARHFPRTDPVVIMLITDGNSALIGRSPGWPEGMYSLLAGFVEPGETIEAAVRREVAEEAGVDVGQVDYLASQPWPFPASLMIGCRGMARTREITLDPAELDDALWLTREEMLEVHAGLHAEIRGARPGAIAHFLLARWLADTLD
mgnify:FL=1